MARISLKVRIFVGARVSAGRDVSQIGIDTRACDGGVDDVRPLAV
jgi:hypothetical protein